MLFKRTAVKIYSCCVNNLKTRFIHVKYFKWLIFVAVFNRYYRCTLYMLVFSVCLYVREFHGHLKNWLSDALIYYFWFRRHSSLTASLRAFVNRPHSVSRVFESCGCPPAVTTCHVFKIVSLIVWLIASRRTANG